MSGALADGPLQFFGVLGDAILMQFEQDQVADPRRQFAGVDGFVEEVIGTRLQPASIRLAWSVDAVRITTGTCSVSLQERNFRSTSRPLVNGIIRSSRTRSGVSRRTISTASRASVVVANRVNPSRFNNRLTTLMFVDSSSTIAILRARHIHRPVVRQRWDGRCGRGWGDRAQGLGRVDRGKGGSVHDGRIQYKRVSNEWRTGVEIKSPAGRDALYGDALFQPPQG